MTKPDPVPALARTDVRPVDPPETQPEPPSRHIGRMLAIGVTVLAVVALLVFGVLVALRQDLVDPALVSTGLFDVWR